MRKKALITGVTGQDGSYLAQLLLSKGYEVHGIVRRSSSANMPRIERLIDDESIFEKTFFLHSGDLDDSAGILDVVETVRPDELYDLGGQSHVRASFDMPEYTGDVSGLAVMRLLEAVRRHAPHCRFYQASSSELFGSSPPPQSEITPFHPRSPYAVAKMYGYWAAVNCREAYGMHASNGILFNHESPRRSDDFVTRKITRAVARIAAGRQKTLTMGNIDSRRDWGFAPDYVECMWKMLQQDEPDDYVIGTGEMHSVRDFLTEAFGYVGLDWQRYVDFDPRFMRPSEVDAVCADPSKARERLKWSPKISFAELVAIMMDNDLALEGVPSPERGSEVLRAKDLHWAQ